MSDQEQLISQFVNVTSASRYLAEQYLSRNKNDLVNAIEDYYASNSTVASVGERINKTTKSKSSGGIRTFRDLNNDDDDSEDDKTNTNFFTGGEKSGLQVEDPNKRDGGNEGSIIDQIFQRAKEQMDQPDDRPSAKNKTTSEAKKFAGTGFKLGDGNMDSEKIVDPSNRSPARVSKVTREITFWKQGFTVGEGPLQRYDDPKNESVLQELNRGRVPMSLLNVEFGQDVDVSVFKKTDEEWVAPKRKIEGFYGSGQRLGSPVPGEFVQKEVKPAQKESVDSSSKPNQEGEGDSTVQIRFANGKRVSHKFNSTDSIMKVYEFVRNHPYTDLSKPFILSHSFPVKPIEESDNLTVSDAKLKNAVIVQKWT